jgi:hypothetical protein
VLGLGAVLRHAFAALVQPADLLLRLGIALVGLRFQELHRFVELARLVGGNPILKRTGERRHCLQQQNRKRNRQAHWQSSPYALAGKTCGR